MFNNFASYGNNNEAIISELRVLIKDPAEELSSDPAVPIPANVGKNRWKVNPDPIRTPEVTMINNLAKDGKNCAHFHVMTPLAVVQEIECTGGLRPDSLYTAVFNAVYKAPADTQEDVTMIHSYVFKTSLYADFEEQIQSCILRDENGDEVRKAVFDVEKAIDVNTIDAAIALLTGTAPADDPLRSDYADEYDRLIDGILKLGVLPVAVTTEFNVIRNSATGNIIGIIVRNPEPFNDPKIPEEDLSDTIELSVDSDPAGDYKAIFSRDKTQAFISNAALDIPSGQVTFTFRYKEYRIHVEEIEAEEVEGVEEEVEEKNIKRTLGYETVETETVSFEV